MAEVTKHPQQHRTCYEENRCTIVRGKAVHTNHTTSYIVLMSCQAMQAVYVYMQTVSGLHNKAWIAHLNISTQSIAMLRGAVQPWDNMKLLDFGYSECLDIGKHDSRGSKLSHRPNVFHFLPTPNSLCCTRPCWSSRLCMRNDICMLRGVQLMQPALMISTTLPTMSGLLLSWANLVLLSMSAQFSCSADRAMMTLLPASMAQLQTCGPLVQSCTIR